jgi:hypothetical protein
MNMMGEVLNDGLEGSGSCVERFNQCMALARIFRQSADDVRGDRDRSARYWQVALQYDAEATRQAVASTKTVRQLAPTAEPLRRAGPLGFPSLDGKAL